MNERDVSSKQEPLRPVDRPKGLILTRKVDEGVEIEGVGLLRVTKIFPDLILVSIEEQLGPSDTKARGSHVMHLNEVYKFLGDQVFVSARPYKKGDTTFRKNGEPDSPEVKIQLKIEAPSDIRITREELREERN